ncbi:MAG: hypothetical protein ACOVP8_02570 [Phycisphaerales bacterium]
MCEHFPMAGGSLLGTPAFQAGPLTPTTINASFIAVGQPATLGAPSA